MSGHSKWATTKRAKAANDAKRSNLFTKLAKNIAIAAREGADPETNFKLRIAIDKARSFSMPKDNIERAVKRGSGQSGDDKIENFVYEAYGPEGIALMIEVITDNKNRTVSNLKHLLNKYGGSLGSDGSVKWLFEPKGQIILTKEDISEEEELQLIDAGAEDIVREDKISVISAMTDLRSVREKIQAAGFEIESFELTYLPKDKIKVSSEEKIIAFLEALDDDDDVSNIYTNADI
ncbi:MAG: YebC/PmpR family DNA-binding transcriptional regulator [Patescibacteria group bacterium]|nr:YebC/PmpR family DNA-binding transcriptional regulator [Patescibacteria group bacterium]